MPSVYIVAGPNGAGKTTFAREFLPYFAKCPHFVNADLIASGLSPFSPELMNIKAGKLLLTQIKEYVERRVDFAFETTMAGRSYQVLLKGLKQRGYDVHIFFLWIPSVKLAMERIRQRVQEGGHNIPDEDVKRRFERGLENFFDFYASLSDSWIIFDNSGERPKEIVRKINNKLKVLDKHLCHLLSKGRIL